MRPRAKQGVGPGSVGTVLARPRVLARLDGILTHRITTVVAGAGAGKTTSLQLWAQVHPLAWHTIDADETVGTLMRSTIETLRLRLPKLAPELLAAADRLHGADAQQAETSGARLGEELAQLPSPRELALVLDDLHLLEPANAAVTFVNSLCRNVPGWMHIVLSSREPIPFSLAHFALESDLLQLNADDLAFTVEETAALLEEAGSAHAKEITGRTAGWPAVTRLAAEAVRTAPDQPLNQLFPHGSDDQLFDYLAGDVFGAEPSSVQRLLRTGAALPWLTPGLVEHLDLEDGPTAYDVALRRGVYFAPAERHPQAATLVPVMRRFLETLPMPPRAEPKLHIDAGNWYRSVGAYAEAIACYRRGNAHEPLAEMLVTLGPAVLSACPAGDIVAACADMPGEFRTPKVIMLQGEAHHAAGELDRALACYAGLTPAEGAIPPELAWRIGLLHYFAGDPAGAMSLYERADHTGEETPDLAMVAAWSAAAAWVQGAMDEAHRHAGRALDMAMRTDDARALAAAHTVLAMVAAADGDRTANDAHYLRALEYAERAQDTLQLIRIRVNRGSRSLEEGLYPAALEEIDVALRLADVAGFSSLRALALSNRGQVLLHQGRLEEAVANLEEARALYRSLNSLHESYPLSHLGDVYALRGDTALARAAYEQAISLAERSGDLQGLIPSLAGIAQLLAQDEPEAAAAAADRACVYGSALDHGSALVAAGWVAHHSGDEGAAELARRAASVARSRRDRATLANALELQAEVVAGQRETCLRQALSIWRDVGDPVRSAMLEVDIILLGLTPESGARIPDLVVALRSWGALGPARDAEQRYEALAEHAPPPLALRTLGGFAVVRDGEVVPTAEWQSKKARDVLKMLIAARGRPLHREVLMDRLWPDEDPGSASNRLSVALSTVRSVLDPARAHAADHYLVSDRDTVALAVDKLPIDVQIYLADARDGTGLWKRGEQPDSIRILERAEALYIGDFLEDEPYEEWAVPVREECRMVYLEVAGILARAANDRQDWEGATRYYLRILERDPYHEPSHLGLVVAMANLGRHGGARRLYGMYVSRMRELTIDPAPFPDIR